MLNRRHLLLALPGLLPGVLAGVLPRLAAAGGVTYAAVVPRPLRFPADFGAHPDFRNEWWYLTGWLDSTDGPLGFQVTFFRVRTDVDPANPSAFAARQLLIAHAAIADPARGRLLVDERIGRTGFGLAEAREADTDVVLDGWHFRRDAATDSYHCRIRSREFRLDFQAYANAPPWPQGDAGFSRKGPLASQASHYYSRPQLQVTATLAVAPAAGAADSTPRTLTGIAWLDHEWSSEPLAPEAVGWDWIGMNLDDGSGLVAFQVRRPADEIDAGPVMTYAARRDAGGRVDVFDPATVSFAPLSTWTSARSGATWPIAQRIRAGGRNFATEALFADQELDSRLTTGAIYWEGASRLLEDGRPVGRGYLEMTGYLTPLKL